MRWLSGSSLVRMRCWLRAHDCGDGVAGHVVAHRVTSRVARAGGNEQGDDTGNVLVEFLLVPLLLIPVALLVIRFWSVQQSELGLTEAARTLSRAAALAGPLTDDQCRAVALQVLVDFGVGDGTDVAIRHRALDTVVVFRRRVDGLLPGAEVTVERSASVAR